MVAAGTLAATVQKLSVRIVVLGQGGGARRGCRFWFQACKPFAMSLVIFEGGGGDRYQASVLCAQQLWWDHRTHLKTLRVMFLLDGGQHLT